MDRGFGRGVNLLVRLWSRIYCLNVLLFEPLSFSLLEMKLVDLHLDHELTIETVDRREKVVGIDESEFRQGLSAKSTSKYTLRPQN